MSILKHLQEKGWSMTETSALPLEYTTRQLLDMCEQALRDAIGLEHQAALARGRSPRIRIHGDEKQAALIAQCSEEASAYDAQAARMLEAAKEHANGLIGREVLLTGTIKVDRDEWKSPFQNDDVSECDMMIGGGHWEVETHQLEVEKSRRTIIRVSMPRPSMMDSLRARIFFNFNGSDYYFELPHNRFDSLVVETVE